MSKTAIDPDDELLGIAHPVPAVPTEYQDVQPDYGPCMSACLDKERRFTLARLLPDVSDAGAARIAGYGNADGSSSAATMARIAFRLTHENPRVAAAMQEVAKIAVRDLAIDGLKALKRIVRQDFHPQQAKVALALVERVDPTVQRQDVNVKHEIIDHRQEALIQLQTLKALGVPRDKLEELFGFTGLPMLERQLTQQESNAEPPITAEYTEIKSEQE